MFQVSTNKVLFIAGPGRSGSTLLDLLLGQIEGFYSTGELRLIWKRGFGENQLCGCRKPFKECEFWTEVVKEAFGGFEEINYSQLEALREPVENYVSKGLYTNSESELPAQYTEYFDACSNLYRAIHKISGCEFIVDSSKNTAHGLVLASIPQLDLLSVHLIRDSRAVAYSWRREKIRPEIHWEQQFMAQQNILKSATRWNSLHKFADRLQYVSQRYLPLRYEDLATNPRKSLVALFANFGIQRASLDFLEGQQAKLKENHTVSGNPIRFSNTAIKIQPDIEWQHAMTNHHKWLVTLITWPLLLKYGYFQGGGQRPNTQVPSLSK
jgi:hypothetical protein